MVLVDTVRRYATYIFKAETTDLLKKWMCSLRDREEGKRTPWIGA